MLITAFVREIGSKKLISRNEAIVTIEGEDLAELLPSRGV